MDSNIMVIRATDRQCSNTVYTHLQTQEHALLKKSWSPPDNANTNMIYKYMGTHIYYTYFNLCLCKCMSRKRKKCICTSHMHNQRLCVPCVYHALQWNRITIGSRLTSSLQLRGCSMTLHRSKNRYLWLHSCRHITHQYMARSLSYLLALECQCHCFAIP